MDETTGRVESASEYGCYVYDNALEMFCKIQCYARKIFPCTRYVNEVTFLVLWNFNEDKTKTLLWLMTHL